MNRWQLDFSEQLDYRRDGDLLVPLTLSSDIYRFVSVRAKLDTGSDFCVFQPRYADALALTIEDGTPQRIRTATGSFLAYGHEVTLTVGDLEWSATVYFADDEYFPVNVVGRVGFLDRLRVGVVDYEQLLYLSAHDESR